VKNEQKMGKTEKPNKIFFLGITKKKSVKTEQKIGKTEQKQKI
jgi:hypothetical protein